ncbi:MAG: ABC transporter permease [Oceanospirillales bacterium]|nr:MAG: ABC transporter permease [Oceanospirillales bacterium]
MLGIRFDKVMPLLTGASLLSIWSLDYVNLQPNRILPGVGYSLQDAVGWWWMFIVTTLLISAFLLSFIRLPTKRLLQLLIVSLLLVFMPISLSSFASNHIPETLTHARTGLGAAFWVLLFLLVLMLIELQQKLKLSRLIICLISILPIISFLFAYLDGGLETLAILREYNARSDQFHQAVKVHITLVSGAVFTSMLLASCLVALMRKVEAAQKIIFPLLNFIQTIPSLALFGLLIAPLGYLASKSEWLQAMNVSGIGWAPAMIALIAYSLLPMVRNTFVALEEVSSSIIEAAKGMGMSPLQVFIQVRLPLAMPVILEGIRITTIQAIGLTAVAALIGAGGLGNFIFQGLGQAAMDMVLLGALPILLLALVADLLFTSAMALFGRQSTRSGVIN